LSAHIHRSDKDPYNVLDMFSSAIWRNRGPRQSNLKKIPEKPDAVYSALSAASACFLADLLTG
jgi:hypothetical protein